MSADLQAALESLIAADQRSTGIFRLVDCIVSAAARGNKAAERQRLQSAVKRT